MKHTYLNRIRKINKYNEYKSRKILGSNHKRIRKQTNKSVYIAIDIPDKKRRFFKNNIAKQPVLIEPKLIINSYNYVSLFFRHLQAI